MLQCVAVCYGVMQCVAVCCSVLQCVAVCYGVMQCVAVCCRVLQCHLSSPAQENENKPFRAASNTEIGIRVTNCVGESRTMYMSHDLHI